MQELHCDLHNFRITGEEVDNYFCFWYQYKSANKFQNFKLSLSELKEGRPYTEISLPVVPKTDEEAERIKKRGEKTKEVMFKELKAQVGEALEVFFENHYHEKQDRSMLCEDP